MNIRASIWSTVLCIALPALTAAACRRVDIETPRPEDIIGAEPLTVDGALFRVARKIPSFAGLFYDEKGVLHVLLTGDASRVVSRGSVVDAVISAELLERSSADGTQIALEPAKTKYNWFDLLDFKAGMRDVLTLPNVTMLDADEAEGVVTIGIADEKARTRVEEFVQRLGVPNDAWRTIRSPYRDRYSDLTDQVRPIIGGIQIKNDAGPGAVFGLAGICTLSLIANRSGVVGFITNSHCTRIQGGTEGTNFYQNGRTPFSLDWVGTESVDPLWVPGLPRCPPSGLCRFSDSAFVTLGLSSNTAMSAAVAQTTTICATGFPCSTTTSSPAARVQITGTALAPLGALVMKVGRTTGSTSGLVTATCIDTLQSGTSFVVLCQSDFSNGSGPGDSGAPVVMVPAGPGLPSAGRLVGVMWGGLGPVSTFSPIAAVLSDLAPISLLLPSPTGTPTPAPTCTSACRIERDACMNDVSSPNGPRPQACVADYGTCLKGC